MTTEVTERNGSRAVGVVAGRGLEQGSSKDLVIPYILLMQGLSTFVQSGGAIDEKTGLPTVIRAGTWVNSLTKKEIVNPSFIPVVLTKYWDVLRQEGTKMVFDYRVTEETDERLKDKRFFNDKKDKTKRANVNTVLAFVGLFGTEPLMLTFTKTSYKAGKKLYTLAKTAGGDLFAHRYNLLAIKETNKEGTYYVAEVEASNEKVTEAEYKEAENLWDSLRDRTKDISSPEAEDAPF